MQCNLLLIKLFHSLLPALPLAVVELDAVLSPPAPASPCNLFANQKFFFCPSVFYQGFEPLLWSQSLDRGAYPVEGYFTFFSQKICWALLVFVFH